MKKLFLLLTGVLLFAAVSAQSLDEIVKKHSIAMKSDQLAKVRTIKDHRKHVGNGYGNANGAVC